MHFSNSKKPLTIFNYYTFFYVIVKHAPECVQSIGKTGCLSGTVIIIPKIHQIHENSDFYTISYFRIFRIYFPNSQEPLMILEYNTSLFFTIRNVIECIKSIGKTWCLLCTARKIPKFREILKNSDF